MNLIASATLDWGIGYKNDLLVHVRKDMVQFRKKTTGNVVVMGRNTLLSMPGQKPLPNRTNIVLSTDLSFAPEGVIMARSVEELLAILQDYDSDSIYIIGGAAVYETMLPYCDKAYITRFHVKKQADRFLPNLDASAHWELTARSPLYTEGDFTYSFDLYEKRG